jgi:hypothetical protein
LIGREGKTAALLVRRLPRHNTVWAAHPFNRRD